jgi:hypothetical protein
LELAALIARGEAAALEVIDDHLLQLAAVNRSVNAHGSAPSPINPRQ